MMTRHNNGLAAFLVSIFSAGIFSAAILLAGVVMPGTPPPRRHDKSPVLSYTERFAANAEKSAKAAAPVRPHRNTTIDRSPRTRLPAKNLK
jgi:hypothetical protein